MFSSLEADGLTNASTHDWEAVSDAGGGTILCRILDAPRFPGDFPGIRHQMLPVTHRCHKCGFEARTDHPPVAGFADCDILIVRSVMES